MLKLQGGQRLPKPEIIPTPSFGINYVLGGGIWSDRMTALWGNFSSGKTTFALMTMARAQKMGYTPVIIDAEGTYTDEYAEACGIDISDRVYLRGTIVEDILKEIVPMMQRRDEKYIFLIDSINAIFFESFNKDPDGGKAIGGSARVQKYLTAKIETYIHPNMAVLYIVQQSVGFQGQTAFVGANMGNYTGHMMCNMIKLFSSMAKDSVERDKDTNKITDQEITWTIDKSKQTASKGTKGTYWWNPDEVTFNFRAELFHYAVRCGIIHKGGAWYTFRDKKGQGEAKMKDLLTDEDWQIIADNIVFIADNADDEEEEVEDDTTV